MISRIAVFLAWVLATSPAVAQSLRPDGRWGIGETGGNIDFIIEIDGATGTITNLEPARSPVSASVIALYGLVSITPDWHPDESVFLIVQTEQRGVAFGYEPGELNIWTAYRLSEVPIELHRSWTVESPGSGDVGLATLSATEMFMSNPDGLSFEGFAEGTDLPGPTLGVTTIGPDGRTMLILFEPVTEHVYLFHPAGDSDGMVIYREGFRPGWLDLAMIPFQNGGYIHME